MLYSLVLALEIPLGKLVVVEADGTLSFGMNLLDMFVSDMIGRQ